MFLSTWSTDSPDNKHMNISKKTLNNIFFLCGLAACVVMLFTFDVSFAELWQHLCRAGYWLIPIVGVWIFVYAINAWAWQCVIMGNCEPGTKLSPWRIYKLTISGYALNYATPVGGLGGEPYRIMELSKEIGNQRATSSVVLYAMMHVFAHFWFWFTSVFLYIALACIGDVPLDTSVAIILGIIVVFCLIAFYLFSRGYRNGLVRKVIKLVGKIPGLKNWSTRFLESHAEALENIDKQIGDLHKQEKKAFYSSLLLEYLSRVVQSLEVMFILLLLGIDCGGGLDGYILTFLHSVLILAFTTLFANLIGFLPMQIGVQEGGMVLSIAALGMAPAVGIFASIIFRVREIIWIAVGIGLMKVGNKE